MTPVPTIRAVEDKGPFLDLMLASWGSHSMMIDYTVYDCGELDLLGAFAETGEAVAYASWTLHGHTALLCALHALAPGQGAAVFLLSALKEQARARGAIKLCAMITNDNMPALAFYQKQGFRFSRLYLDAIDDFRSVIPTIIRTGHLGIPIHDAIELEIAL